MTTERPRPTPPVTPMRADTAITAEPPRRRVEIAWLRRNGDVQLATQSIPAIPLFEDCFAAFTHGTLLQTPQGPTAIEDILPGDHVITEQHGPQPVLWRGSMTCQANTPHDRCRTLTRITADGFGIGRPLRDMLIGPGGRLLCRARSGPTRRGQALAPVTMLHDGASVFAVTPPGAVQLYHLVLPIHATLRANGLEMESYHPGISLRATLQTGRQMAQFLAIFPHIDQPGDFGPLAIPHMTDGSLDAAPAA